MDSVPPRIADAGFGAAVAGNVWVHIAHLNEVLQLVALVLTSFAALAAGLYHLQSFLARRRTK